MIDINGNDWIGYHPEEGPPVIRGIPNMGAWHIRIYKLSERILNQVL